MEVSRRRLLQVFAAAPFLPWADILAEATKPKIYPAMAIETLPPIMSRSVLFDQINEATLKHLYPSLADQIYNTSPLYEALMGNSGVHRGTGNMIAVPFLTGDELYW